MGIFTWRAAMDRALYGPGGFFLSGAPAEHFRTSVHAASPLFAGALLRLLEGVDRALGRPARLDLVDVGAGRGELLTALVSAATPSLAARLRPVAVELAPRPPDLPERVAWLPEVPERVTGLLLATEWLDNVPLDVAALDADGTARYVLVDGSLGPPLRAADAGWMERWWPLEPGLRAEIGAPRDAAWAAAVSTVEKGLAVTVDYGHLREGRPPLGTLTGYRGGRQMAPVPDGSCDLTAHVAFDALAAAARHPDGEPELVRQRDALRALGVSGARPPLALASSDPAAYLAALAGAGAAAELTDPAGLGGHFWLIQPVGIPGPVLRCLA